MGKCDLYRFCQDEKHEDVCGDPDVRESYCMRYQQIKQALVQGAEVMLPEMHPVQRPSSRTLASLFNSEEQVYGGGTYFVQHGGAGLRA